MPQTAILGPFFATILPTAAVWVYAALAHFAS
jgi:hypothetical protein